MFLLKTLVCVNFGFCIRTSVLQYCDSRVWFVSSDGFPPVAQLDSAADSDSGGRGFESLRADQFSVKFGYNVF